jgi:hypothetical protein
MAREKGDGMREWIVVLSVVLLPASLWAQESTPTWPGLDVSSLPTVHVVDDKGDETTGKLLRFDVDSLVLLVEGTERRFEAGRVRRIDKQGDSLRNGALIGTIVGIGIGALAAMSECPGSGGSCPGSRAAFFVLSVGTYAAIGTGIDALIPGRTTLYVARQAVPASRHERAAPHSYGLRAGLNVRLTW